MSRVATALVAGILLAACGSSPVQPSTPTPPTVSSTPTATAGLSPSAETGASAIDPVVLLRVEIRGDISLGRVPSLTVYRDGTVLRRSDDGGRLMRLTGPGTGLLLAPVMDSGLLVTSGEIRPDPGYDAGFVTYTIDLQRGEEIVHRSTTNVLLNPATRAESERIIALAEHLDGLESWLPAEAWATGPASAIPWIPSDFLLKITVFEKQPGVEYPARPLDVADVAWPLEGRLGAFGEAQAEPPLGAGTASRCGPVTSAEATAVRRALAAAPLIPSGEQILAELDWAAARSQVTVSLTGLLPDDRHDCSVDQSWP